jgi:hypothetical protein
VVEHTAELIRATDSPETYDNVAHAALSFASYDGGRGSGQAEVLASFSAHENGCATEVSDAADYSDSGWAVRRSRAYTKAAA